MCRRWSVQLGCWICSCHKGQGWFRCNCGRIAIQRIKNYFSRINYNLVCVWCIIVFIQMIMNFIKTGLNGKAVTDLVFKQIQFVALQSSESALPATKGKEPIVAIAEFLQWAFHHTGGTTGVAKLIWEISWWCWKTVHNRQSVEGADVGLDGWWCGCCNVHDEINSKTCLKKNISSQNGWIRRDRKIESCCEFISKSLIIKPTHNQRRHL